MTLEERLARLELQVAESESLRIRTSLRSSKPSEETQTARTGWQWLSSPGAVTTDTATTGWEPYELPSDVPSSASNVLLTVRANTPAVSGASEATIKARRFSGDIEVILRNTTPSSVAGDDHTVQAIAPVQSRSFELEITGDWAVIDINVVAYQ